MPFVSLDALRAAVPLLRRDAIFTDLLAMRYLAPDAGALEYVIESPTGRDSEAARAFEALASVLPGEGDPEDEGWRLHSCYRRMEEPAYYLYFPFAEGGQPTSREAAWRKGDYNRSGLQRRFKAESRSPELQGGWVEYEEVPEERGRWNFRVDEGWGAAAMAPLLLGQPIHFWSFAAWVLRYCPIPEGDAAAWVERTVLEQLRLPDEFVADTEEEALGAGAWFFRDGPPPEGWFSARERIRPAELIALLVDLETERGFRLPGELGHVRREALAGGEGLRETLSRAGDGRRLLLEPSVLSALITAVRLGKHVMLMGPPGTGKSTLARNVAAAAEAGLFEGLEPPAGSLFTTATAGWTTFDIIGGYVPDPDGGLEFRPGIFLDAFGSNRWVVVDEMNRAEVDKAFGQLLTVLSDVDASVELPFVVEAGGDRVRPQVLPTRRWADADPDRHLYAVPPDWHLVGTMNTFDKNTLFTLSYAFMRRFAVIYVDALDAATTAGIAEAATGLAGRPLAKLRRLLVAAEQVGRPLGPSIAIDVAKFVSLQIEDGLPGHAAAVQEMDAEPAGLGAAADEAADLDDLDAAPVLEDVREEAEVDQPNTDPFLEAIVAFVLPQLEGMEPEGLVEFRDRLLDSEVVPANLEVAFSRRLEQLLGLPA